MEPYTLFRSRTELILCIAVLEYEELQDKCSKGSKPANKALHMGLIGPTEQVKSVQRFVFRTPCRLLPPNASTESTD